MNFKEFTSPEKLRGGYYTPDILCDYLTRWISTICPRKILEPSCGDGNFLEAAHRNNPRSELIGYELDTIEARKAHDRLGRLKFEKFRIHDLDFLDHSSRCIIENTSPQYDAIIGNPPFIRYQYLPTEFQYRSELIFKALGCKFTKHTNAWVPFILASIAMLRPGGRLGMIVPSEIVHVMHAQSLRDYMISQCSKVVIIDPEELWFEGTLQGAVMLMAEKKEDISSASYGVSIVPVKGKSFLHESPDNMFRTSISIKSGLVSHKWTKATLPVSTISLYEDLSQRPGFLRFSDAATVDVGIVTGANKFFLVDDATINEYQLSEWAHPMFGRSEHCPGVVYDERQHKENSKNGKPTNFLWFKDRSVEEHPIAKKYIELGEVENYQKRYKCRIRSPWYKVPSVRSTQVGMLKRSHETPRLIHNRVGAFTTDTAYRIDCMTGLPEQLVYGFINPLTALSAELEGRYYGGGVLELVPSEIERLIIPTPSNISSDVDELDRLIRSTDMNTVLEIQGNNILAPLGVSSQEQQELLDGWKFLKNRRHRISD